jgi:uncharacterized protein YndB with AHSA1/START domain
VIERTYPTTPERVYAALYQDIVPNERIITTYEMHTRDLLDNLGAALKQQRGR